MVIANNGNYKTRHKASNGDDKAHHDVLKDSYRNDTHYCDVFEDRIYSNRGKMAHHTVFMVSNGDVTPHHNMFMVSNGGGGWCVYLPSPSGLAHSASKPVMEITNLPFICF